MGKLIGRGPSWTAVRCGQFLGAADGTESNRPGQAGQQTPSDLRRSRGSPRHSTDGANRNDPQQALALVDAIPSLQGERGRPRHRPESVLGDRGYDAESIRQGLRARRIIPFLAKRNTEHGSGLGRWRWVVERTFVWLNQFRRLRVRYEKRADIHEAFLSLGCALICWRFLQVDLVAE